MRNRRRDSLRWGVYGFTILAVLVLILFGNYQYTKNYPGGNDFLIHWNNLRSLLISGQSPYSETADLKTQDLVYGRAALPGEDPLRETDPLYSVVFTLPFALIPDFPFARALWMTFLEGVIIALVIGSIRLTQWRISFVGSVIFLIFSLGWYHGILPLINGNMIILVALFITGGLLAIRENADELAGVLFAFSTIKPQVVLVFLIFILIWGILKSKWRLLGWMFGTILILAICAILLIPDWLIQNLRAVLLHPEFSLASSPMTSIRIWLPALGKRISLVIMIILAGLLIVSWLVSVKMNFRGFLWTACLTLTASQFFGTQTNPDNLVLMFPALALVLAVVDERWRRRGQVVIGSILLLLFIGLWTITWNTVSFTESTSINPVMYFPFPIFLIIALFWIRWWAIHPPSEWIDPLFTGEYLH